LEPKLPYEFAAAEDTSDTKSYRIVNIVMPLGGSQSALFRYPKEGEKVLVGVDDSDNSYLLGYIPEKNTNDNIYTGNDNNMILPGEEEMAGQFFRYKGPNDDTNTKEEYSEIGFYNEKTKWKPIEKEEYPLIDTLKITSKGDINQKATNHHQTKAKRFELLVNCEGSKASDKESKEPFAFGDKEGDDSELYAGDAHIRAKNRIIIKAEKEIVLQVGRSSILITDKGIKIVSRRTRSNFESGWDTSMSLEPLTGVIMTGKKIIGRGGFGFELSEMYGGSIISYLGVLRIAGLDVRISTIGAVNYLIRLGINTADVLQNAITMGKDINDKYTKGFSASSSVSTGLRISGMALANAIGGSGGHKEHDLSDFSNVMLMATDIIMFATLTVGYVLEPIYFSEKQLREESDIRDKFYYSLAVIEYGMALTAAISLGAFAFTGFLWESIVHLGGEGTVSVNAKAYKNNALCAESLKSPTAGESEKKHMTWTEVVREVFEVLAGGMEASGEAIGESISEHKSDNEKFEEELRSL
jgi:hypothetical protein